jgi:hypothetical protein
VAEETTLSRLTAEQANLMLQIDHLQDQASGIRPKGRATIIETASPARRQALAVRYVMSVALGMLVALVLAATVLVVRGSRDRRLRYRDQIADAVGSPVLASLRSRAPGQAAGWVTLLEGYEPDTVDAWALRRALRQLAPVEPILASTSRGRRGGHLLHPPSLTVVTLSGDSRGLAVGPQIAAFTASSGIRTRLLPAQGHESAAGLWAACSSVRGGDEVRPGLVVADGPESDPSVELVVVLAVIDRTQPQLDALPSTEATVLALSAGSATGEHLARAAVAVDQGGSRIDGVVVADPDDLDRTNGRLLQHERSHQVPLPMRLTGVPAPKSRRHHRSRSRRRPG